MKHIDKLFKEKLYDHEAVVPDGMWEKIAPIAEEETGRAILWFWFAGLLALMLGGLGIYKAYVSTQSDPSDPNALVIEETPQQNSTSAHLTETTEMNIIETSSKVRESADISNEYHPASQESSSSNISEEDLTKMVKPVKSNKPSKNQKTISKHNKIIASIESISNTVENIGNVTGVPANLVITKSYINEEGSVIKQSNLTEDSGNNNPVYDVIINSEAKDLNAGALLRIIEPLENIPLPAFHKTLKKKYLAKEF